MLTALSIQSLALNLVLHHLGNHIESTATWIDTTGDFSSENTCQLLDCIKVIKLLIIQTRPFHHNFRNLCRSLNDYRYLSLSTLTQRKHLWITQFRTLMSVQLLSFCLSNIESFQPHRRLLVIDAITPLLGPLLGPASAQGHAIMTDFMRQLQSLAQSTNITILVSS
jgi:RAD51-like protein 3